MVIRDACYKHYLTINFKILTVNVVTSAYSSDSKPLSLYFFHLCEPPYWMAFPVKMDTNFARARFWVEFLSAGNQPKLLVLIPSLLAFRQIKIMASIHTMYGVPKLINTRQCSNKNDRKYSLRWAQIMFPGQPWGTLRPRSWCRLYASLCSHHPQEGEDRPYDKCTTG